MRGIDMIDDNCLFCKIARGAIPANIIYQDDHIMAFHDINPQAPVHILIIPKKHIPTLLEVGMEDRELLSDLFMTANKLAREHGLDDKGFRTVFNCKESAGQAVFHIHLHLMGGRNFGWPPG